MTTAPVAAAEYVDLHAHSTASDGSQSPEGVIQAAVALQLAAIALTDHDTLGGVAVARRAAQEAGIRLVAGVELSVVEGNRETHLLGLHIIDVSGLDDALVAFRAARQDRAQRMVATLNTLGIPVGIEAVLTEAGAGAVGRPHVARALVAGGWVADAREAFDRYLGGGRPAHVPKQEFPMSKAINLIHGAGGFAILAHPGYEGTRARVEGLAAIGLDGLEVLHPSHSAEDVQRLRALADYFRLLKSGGSDWHGARAGSRMLANMRVPAAWLAEHDARLAGRATSARQAG
ncbi:MAG: PHP domain-containing protein [Gemmatimonadaceae bacterium]